MNKPLPALLSKSRFLRGCKLVAMGLGLSFINSAQAQTRATYYIDGYHGGVWGHYPDWNTRFMVDMLKKHPYWKINLELEPETWDRAAKVDPSAYQELKAMLSGPTSAGCIEYVNPSYAQSYMYTIDGESIIRQLSYGMQMLRQHFPGIQFSMYSSEEPCFTSALPQILQSFGIRYASLKNPNTCFGGYTAAHGGELVNWQGPDGTTVLTVPRYEVESLLPQSTWQTNAWNNSPAYVNAAFQYGVPHPLGMTLQDAGWKGGPFLGDGDAPCTQNQYVTWRDYFKLVQNDARPVWKVSQEDIKVSLVWGSQITQQIAQEVRHTENKLLAAEKLLALTDLINPKAWPQVALDSAWRTLLLSQHHDCWIVPYNTSRGNSWADKVVGWTTYSNIIADSLVNSALQPADNAGTLAGSPITISVYNTQLHARQEPVTLLLPAGWSKQPFKVTNVHGKEIPAQLSTDSSHHAAVVFNAAAPAFGVEQYKLSAGPSKLKVQGAKATRLNNGNYKVETDQYSAIINPKQGGSIASLYAKKLHKEFVDTKSAMKFNALRGYFNEDGGFKASADTAAKITVVENGPVKVKLQIDGKINGTAWTEFMTFVQGQPVIDMDLTLNWKHNVGIGEDTPKGTYDIKSYHKAFYDDRKKLLAVFPLNLKNQKVYVNAPFDVTESKLKNTFFTTWDSIKNNILLNWVDVTDDNHQYGMALFTDHTTNYAHGEDFPLGLTLQYSGMGLWGRNYTISGPTHIHYALMPHQGKWDAANVWSASAQWNEPLMAYASKSDVPLATSSLISNPSGNLSMTTAKSEGDTLTIRVFNAGGQTGRQIIRPKFTFDKAVLENLDGKVLEELPHPMQNNEVALYIPKFGIRTIRFTHVQRHF